MARADSKMQLLEIYRVKNMILTDFITFHEYMRTEATP